MNSKKYVVFDSISILCGLILILAGCDSSKNEDMANAELSTRGKYLSEIGGCADCHSPKIFADYGVRSVDYKRIFSGHPQEEGVPEICLVDLESGAMVTNKHFTAYAGLWGLTFASNLTPDKETGIGSWSVDQFIDAMRTRHDLPMPGFWAEQLSDEELSDIYAYLMTMPAIKNKVPPSMSFKDLKDYLER